MKKISLFALPFFLFSCDIEKTEEGESPELDVDVEAESGEMPEYDVDWANVNVNTKTKMVEVPKVIVTMEKEEVEVPSIDVSIPDDDREKMEQTIMIEAEVSETMHELDIEKVYAMQNNLYVIAELEKGDKPLNGETVRVSDQIELNAPELNVKYYIIGNRPDGEYNKKHRYISSEDEIQKELDEAQLIYEG